MRLNYSLNWCFCNCKTNTIIVIDCQPFQHPLSHVLLRIFSFCLHSQSQHLHSHKQHHYHKSSWWWQANQLKSFLITLLNLKSNLIAHSSHEQLPAKSWRIVRTNLHSKTSASLAFESQRKILHHKELNLSCSVTITNGTNIYIRFVSVIPR